MDRISILIEEIEKDLKELKGLVKEDKVQKIKFLDSVYLAEEEHQKLIELYGEKNTKEYIETLNDYIESKGKKYKSHYHTILAWHRKDKPKENKYNEF